MQLLSAFGGGLIVIPILILAGIIIFTISGIRSSKSGSTSGGNISFVKTWQFVFALILTAALIGVTIWMYNER